MTRILSCCPWSRLCKTCNDWRRVLPRVFPRTWVTRPRPRTRLSRARPRPRTSKLSSRTPTLVDGWSVGRWSQAIKVRSFIHLGYAHSKKWAMLIASSVSIWYLVLLFWRVIELLCTLFFVRIWQPATCGILFVNNHKNRNQLWTAVFIKKPAKTYHKSENGNRHSTSKLSMSWSFVSASEMTCIVSSGALNSTHSPPWSFV